ncbi:tRNA synthetases class I-domain-containing protein [Dichotomocladium elegans]|nr:tRNA synthetases class I-domain-containing protein [Dichotomocladium elegans]
MVYAGVLKTPLLWPSLRPSFRNTTTIAQSSTKRSLIITPTLFAKSAQQPKNPYTDTILLPKTPFPLRANAVVREHLFKDRCTKDLYDWQLKNNPKDLFVLHDGPPYANGDVHLGHALNKILKDIVNRYKMIQGHKVWYRPGWDCHGLPIELKALEQIRQSGTKLSAMEIRQLAKKRALSEIEKQKKDFRSWAVIGDWENAYQTMTKDYEIRQLRVFHEMMKKGYIYRQMKPVYWSPSSKSALAEAELEYNEQHISRSIYVRFPLATLPLNNKWKNYSDIAAVIWTTTPWTIPANKAIAVNPNLKYSLTRLTKDGKSSLYLLGSDRVTSFVDEIGADNLEVLDQVLGSELVGMTYIHPFCKSSNPVLLGDHVTAESGTGLVHTAPGHGMEDYELCLKHGIAPFSPVDDEGRFTAEAGAEFSGKDAFGEGVNAVIAALQRESSLVKQGDYIHKYPYDWRTKKPVMLRATAQWFANVENLQKDATGEALLTNASVEHIIKVFNERGTDSWWEEADDNVFLAPEYRNNGRVYKRGYDTMDVWFDSGTSWMMIPEYTGRDGKEPLADVYLEGSDQHRGWFQSSLLTSSRKMSKSIGNTIVPSLITHGGKDKKSFPAYGTDVLRMWVASCEYGRDVTVGPSIIAQVSDSIRKLRTTARFLLGNLHDFTYKDIVAYDQLNDIDKYMLHELYGFSNRVTEAYENYAFNKGNALHIVQHFTTNDLSAFYFDIIKDRLYNEQPSSSPRRTAQTVLYHVLQAYTASLAPVACHTAEEIYENYRSITPHPETSVFKQGWISAEPQWNRHDLESKWSVLKQLKSQVNQVLEAARQDKMLRSSQEAVIDLIVDQQSQIGAMIHGMPSDELADLFLTSRVNVHGKNSEVSGRFEQDIQLGSGKIHAHRPHHTSPANSPSHPLF